MINKLIDKITPIYNDYRENKDKMSPNLSICLMYEIGGLLKEYLDSNDVKPHNLYRKIYGRSEGSFDNTKKSYITREFLGRCFILKPLLFLSFPLKLSSSIIILTTIFFLIHLLSL